MMNTQLWKEFFGAVQIHKMRIFQVVLSNFWTSVYWNCSFWWEKWNVQIFWTILSGSFWHSKIEKPTYCNNQLNFKFSKSYLRKALKFNKNKVTKWVNSGLILINYDWIFPLGLTDKVMKKTAILRDSFKRLWGIYCIGGIYLVLQQSFSILLKLTWW